ncbi:HAD family hydrolase [soil metagenome]
MVDAVIFDGDGVVFDSEELSVLAFRRTLERYGLKLTREECGRFIGAGTSELLDILRGEYGLQINEHEYIVDRDQVYEECCLEVNGPQPMPGIVSVLDWLETKDIPWAMATSASREKLAFNFERTGLAARFPVAVLGEDVANGKPAPDIFIEAARRLGVDPKRCIVMEDSLNGLRGAIAAGCAVIAIEGSHSRSELLKLTARVCKNPVEAIAMMDL